MICSGLIVRLLSNGLDVSLDNMYGWKGIGEIGVKGKSLICSCA
jgi:hypothetical protein